MRTLLCIFALASSTGCSVIVGSAIDDRPTDGMDGGPRPDTGPRPDGGPMPDVPVAMGCTGESDGAPCEGAGGVTSICVSEECVPSECGDTIVDMRIEDCEDGNEDPGDGCEPGTCQFSCEDDAACDDGIDCTGTETCDTDMNVCALGEALPDGTACVGGDGTDGECRSGECVAAGCGNMVTAGTEECDDGNEVDGDGCDNDCTFSCETDEDCNDGDVCNGTETCMEATHRCNDGTDMMCDDSVACTTDSCDPLRGCLHVNIDVDGDGHPARMGSCGDDCNDTMPTIYPGAEELCDGVDNDCDMMTDEVAPTWYVDCDNDNFASSTTSSRMGCTEPAAALAGCPTGTPGGWTSMRPIDAASTDCYDRNALVRPNQTTYQTTAASGRSASVDFDYDCDGSEERQYGSDGSGFIIACTPTGRGTDCFGTSYWSDGTVPACGAPAESLSECYWNLISRSCARRTRSVVQACL